MKTKLLVAFFLLSFLQAYSQEYVFGNVYSEFGDKLPAVTVINIRTEDRVLSDVKGHFMIRAKTSDELRFVKTGFERSEVKLRPDHFTEPLQISLNRKEQLIEEVEVAFRPTGNIETDVKRLDPPKKTVALNSELRDYMKSPPATASPALTTPSAFAAPNFSAGSGNILGFLKAARIINKRITNPLTTPTYAEQQRFYTEIRKNLNYDYYQKYGLDQAEIDQFIIFADERFELAKRYRKNFRFAAIDAEMKAAFTEYLKLRKSIPKLVQDTATG